MRYELPPGLTAEEERAIEAALRQYLGPGPVLPGPWVLAGRLEALGLGALQARRLAEAPWRRAGWPFARRGTERRPGRGDTR